ncbi:uncharacterized protein LOC141570759 [Rhinolophus sinicus]|uniref:uncharacterized protein LOC141570759 n=1 Tax=Rhinolophus sinicus TaxID=89399 RepID=UPI003D78CA9F
MEPLPAAPPARGTSKGGSAPRATTPSGPAPSLPPRWGPQKNRATPRPGPTSSQAPASFLPAPASCFPAPARPPAAPSLCRRRPLHHTSSSWRWRRVRSPPPPPPYHVPHPGLRHRETRSQPAWVGAQRPARARRPQDQSAALRPGRDTTPSRPGHRAPAGPARLFRAQALLPSRRD